MKLANPSTEREPHCAPPLENFELLRRRHSQEGLRVFLGPRCEGFRALV